MKVCVVQQMHFTTYKMALGGQHLVNCENDIIKSTNRSITWSWFQSDWIICTQMTE